MKARTKTVNLIAFRDLDLDEITMRETYTVDTMDAVGRASPPGGKRQDPAEFNFYLRLEQIAGAVVSYVKRGETAKVEVAGGSCRALVEHWNQRTKEACGKVYDYLNGFDAEEEQDFQRALKGVSASPMAPTPSSAI